ncbi:cupin domain-containing protein [Streptomyces sp. NPDC001793]|uniref:cupin domain-containing protein n=1 Tax=unclassified Streptomyces TaxID=2593676 RepID=UPI0033311034
MFTIEPTPELSPQLLRLLPEQGSFELQHDQAGKTHNWHHHSLDEELFVISGEVLLFWVDGEGEYHERRCEPGTWITLPAGTRHGSVAGATDVVYMIRPENGRTARTTFLEPAEFPHPTPSFAQGRA